MTLSQFDSGLTSVRPQKSWTSFFYSSINSLSLKTLENPTLLLGKSLAKYWEKKNVCVYISIYQQALAWIYLGLDETTLSKTIMGNFYKLSPWCW